MNRLFLHFLEAAKFPESSAAHHRLILQARTAPSGKENG